MLNKVLVFATGASVGAELVSKANSVAANTMLITNAEGLTGADTVYTYGADNSVVMELKAIADIVREYQPELLLCEASGSGRLVAGYLAAVIKTCPLPELLTLEIGETGIVGTRMVHGGSAIKTESVSYPAIAVVGAGVVPGEENLKSGEVKALPAVENEGIELVSVDVASGAVKDLAGAKKVVGVGRGLGSADNLPMVEELAALMEAEVGCTRPVAEEEGWFPKNRYIGISGVMLKSNLYFAMGVSGQVQHMVGVNSCGSIFALDRNENAVIFEECDYGLVGNITTAVPAIIEKLKA